jgi:phosphatidylserine/phosphatidylglycerophosphate/cardiolipin synthase-like enzyme
MQCETIIAGDFVKKVVPLIDSARHTLDLCVFDWRWYPQDPSSPVQLFNQAIVSAVRRGVTVRALVNSDSILTTLRSVGVDAKKFVSGHLLHCKFIILDSTTIITGSHNYTQSAFSSNFELSVVLSDGVDCFPFQDFFNRLITK